VNRPLLCSEGSSVLSSAGGGAVKFKDKSEDTSALRKFIREGD
jgi:hypothetical protein